jgi:AsmA protein
VLMGIGVKRAAIAIVFFLAGAISFVAAATHRIPLDTMREAVKREIGALTGLDPVLRGPVSLSMFPAPTLNFFDVVLGEPVAGATNLEVKQLAADLRLIPLLLGRIEIADISLIQPRIGVTRDADGHTNWSPLIDALAGALKPGAERRERALSFSEIRINDGIVVLRDADDGNDEVFEHVELSLAWPSIAKSFAASGRFVWHNETVETNIAITDFPAALAGDNSGFKFRASTGALKTAFDGTMSYRPSLKIDGTLAADSPSLRDALRWIGERSLPDGGLGHLSVKAHAAISGGAIALSNLNAELDGNIAEGALSYTATGRRSLQGTLAVGSLDVRPYISSVHLVADDTREWDRRAFGLDWLNRWDADLRVSAERVQFSRAELGRTAVATTIRMGRLDVTVGESQAFDGAISGTVAIARSESGIDIKSHMQFLNVDLEKSLGQMLGMRRLESMGNITLEVTSTGSNVHELASNLGGSVAVTAKQGALTGLNIEQLMRRLQRSPLSGSGDFRGGRTPFERLNVGLQITQGVAVLDDAVLESASIRLALTGSTSIADRDLDLSGTAELIASASAETRAPFELPFTVRGAWDNPSILPDARVLIQKSRATGPLLDALQDKKTRDDARKPLERLIGPPDAPDSNPR